MRLISLHFLLLFCLQLAVPAMASQTLADRMLDVRKVEGIDVYYNLSNGLALQGEYRLVRDSQGYTQATFDQGIAQGNWQVFDQRNQRLLSGQYKAGRQDGEWQYFSVDGSLEHIEHYDAGVATGVWQRFNGQRQVVETTEFERGAIVKVSRFYDNGKMQSVEHYQNNLRHGLWQTFHANGEVAEAWTYANNQLNGPYQSKDEQGSVLLQGQYNSNGQQDGLWTQFFAADRPAAKTHYLNGQRHGVAEQFNTDGTLISRCAFQHGAEHGECREFHVNGQLARVSAYQQGKLHGEHLRYSSEGVLLEKFNFIDGMQAGEQLTYHSNGKLDHRIQYHTTERNANGQFPQHGVQERYRDDGLPIVTAHFAMGLRDGLFKRFQGEKLVEETQYKAGKRHGVSKTFYSSGEPREHNTYVEERLTGPFKAWHINGQLREEGERDNGHIIGRYQSYYDTGKPQKLEHFATEKKPGEHSYGRVGEYKQWAANGDLTQEGQYLDNKRHGIWITYQQGEKSREQEFINGNAEGRFVDYYQGRRRSSGFFLNNQKTGEWIEYYYQADDPTYGFIPEGTIRYKTQWQDNKQHGKAEFYTAKNILYKVESWDKGVKSGDYQEFYVSNGEPKLAGNMQKGEWFGLWQAWYEDGTLAQAVHYDASRKHGLAQEYYDNGQLKSEIEYEYDKPHGRYELFHLNGRPQQKESYVKGLKEGKAEYFHPNGKPAQQGDYLRDRKEGEWLEYWPNGQVRTQGSYISNRPSGDWQYFDQHGKLIKTEHKG
ncbi:toxin-antitoxin system YwqK family antitoxin [Rheinheimera oceanensis]|uniref:toxin-antitoxin system YwqK family antitoxin n=1 Tax=Rheinheimera oceanensis TaxID=2817449 RepID=UPI001BFECCE2